MHAGGDDRSLPAGLSGCLLCVYVRYLRSGYVMALYHAVYLCSCDLSDEQVSLQCWKLSLVLITLQVLKLKVDLIGHLAMSSVFTKRSVECCLVELVDKVGDAKNGLAVQETLSCLAECTSLDYIALQVLIAISWLVDCIP